GSSPWRLSNAGPRPQRQNRKQEVSSTRSVTRSVWANNIPRSAAMKKILVVDIGGTNVKLMIKTGKQRQFDSGPRMTPKQMIKGIKASVRDLKFDAISIGFPA